ncbi:hypothetical protein CYMTET_28520, partial [Cymbomonas tetramitiformis]
MDMLWNRSCPPPMLVGVTNLYFIKAVNPWPHVLSVGLPDAATHKVAAAGRQVGKSNKLNELERRPGKGIGARFAHLGAAPLRAFRSARLTSRGPQQLLHEHTQWLWTSHEPYTKPDTEILNSLVDVDVPGLPASEILTGTGSNSSTLRRHFAELTANFLAPFTPFI